MKHLKKFEDIVSDDEFEEFDDNNPAFNDGDYVKLTELEDEDEDALGFKFPYGIIVDSNYNESDGWEYWIGYYNEDGEFVQSSVSGTFYIERLMTDEEKKYFKSDEFLNEIKLLKAINNYNL
jgi:hypothetical protein